MSGSGPASDLDVWLTPFLEVLGRKTRRTWAPLYLRGLLGRRLGETRGHFGEVIRLAKFVLCGPNTT